MEMDDKDKEETQFLNEYLQQPLIARIATADETGQPHVVPVWYVWDGEALWISSYSNTRKISDLKKNPKISIAIDDSDVNNNTRSVILEGQVELIREPREFLVKQFILIYTRYLGESGVLEEDPQEWINDPHNLLIKLKPEKIMVKR
jgi:nitroimidazol reductase NimA-like FMN-containing flavoprotein (pyridoxamine 5'-phosphate oxidase superfamily)